MGTQHTEAGTERGRAAGSPFSDEQIAALAAELDPHLAARMAPTGTAKVSYIEAHVVIEQANRIFGYGNWGYRLVHEDRDVDPDSGAGLYSAWVEVTVRGCEPTVELGDCPLQVKQGNKANSAQKSMARKGAVTDGMKRGLRHFGDQFGNKLYDKDSDIHAQIDQAEREARQASGGARPPAPSPARAPLAVVPTSAPAPALPLGQAMNEDELRAQVARGLAADKEAASKLPKAADDMSADELEKTLAWLRNRAKRQA